MRRIAVILLTLLAVAPAGAALRVGPTGRTLIDGAGRPFLLVGDSAWSLMAQLTLPEAESYFRNRRDKGFDLVLVNLIEHQYAWNAPANAYGDRPFTGAPFTTPNEPYFAHADHVIAAAAANDIVVLLAPVYLGFECGGEGWCAEVEAATPADLRSWGRFLGARYQGFDNIVWLIGGDADPTPVQSKLSEVVAGIREFDTVHLITAHNQPESTAISPWPGSGWLGINNLYTYDSALYVGAQGAYDAAPTLPFFLAESAYENEHDATPQQLRAQSYWTVLAGGFGHIFGNCPIWHFGSAPDWCGSGEWEPQLDGPGSLSMMYFQRLFRSRHWDRLVPDQQHAVVTAGFGSWGAPDYVTAAVASDGTSIIAYLPTERTLTVDTSALAGDTVRAWWYDPAQGFALSIGTFAEGARDFSAPSAGDWVLVVDDAALDWPAPGLASPAAAAPAAVDAAQITLEPSDPNPFAGATTLRYSLARSAHVRVLVYNVAGALVRTLVDADLTAGAHSARWDGRTQSGGRAGAGVYLCRVQTSEAGLTRKLVLLP